MGILCKHALMVFNCMDVIVLSNNYILKRWMKNVRNRVNSDFQESGNGGDGHVSEMVFVNQIMRWVYDLTQLCKPHEDTRKGLYRLVDTAKDEIFKLVSNLSIDDETPCDDIRSDGVCKKEKEREKLKFQVQKEPKGRDKVYKRPPTHKK